MTGIEIALCVSLLVLCAMVSIGVKAAYRNGVNDGYGFSREPGNPGYFEAGEHLRKTMIHRWPELANSHPEKPNWRIGLKVQGKYRGRLPYSRTGEIAAVFPCRHLGIVDPNGVLAVTAGPGIFIVAGADQFVTA